MKSEIDLKINGKDTFEYETYSVPQVGEYLDIRQEHVKGIFKVKKITHKIFEDKERENILNYVEVEAESVIE